MKGFKYKAFISYSHKDREHAKWLHRKLETYTFPRHLIDPARETGQVPKKLKPIFRDREELAAGHNLGEKIETALKASENLIIICSPNAAASHWVNQEVLFFKRHNRGAKIFSVIVDGHPFAQDPNDECFPKALRFEIDEGGELSEQPAEPLAADLRETGDGRRLGLLKLISGMAGLGVNDLVQRDLQRARRRVMAITAAASAIVLMMGGLTWAAMDARQEAEQRRDDAEGQIEFMLTDLKEELEGVGRLDALKAVGERAAKYYDNYRMSDHDNDALGRRARVFHYLGELQDKYGNLDEADKYFKKAYDATKALLARDPDNPDRIFDHAQSASWMGYQFRKRYEYELAKPYFGEYTILAHSLSLAEPDTLRGIQEITYAQTNMGTLWLKIGEPEKAYNEFEVALEAYEQIRMGAPEDVQANLYYANCLAWLADAAMELDDFSTAMKHRLMQKKVYKDILEKDPQNKKVIFQNLNATIAISRIELERNNPSGALNILAKDFYKSEALWSEDKINAQWMKNFGFMNLMRLKAAGMNEDSKSYFAALDAFNAFTMEVKALQIEDDTLLNTIENEKAEIESQYSDRFDESKEPKRRIK